MTGPTARRVLRVAGGACFAGAAALWLTAAPVSAATTLAPTKTAWYDNSGAQQVTGETTPSSAQPGELEVAYAPASATVPQETTPSTPGVPGAPVAPTPGQAGGSSAGGTLAFAAVEYDVPLQSAGQSVDPASITAALTLSLDQTSSQGVAAGDLIACPTQTTLWSAGGDQDASQAPPYACSTGAVSGQLDTTAHTVTFDLSQAQESALSPGSFSLVIVPGPTPSGPFQAVFAAPGAASFTVTGESPGQTPGPDQQLNTNGPGDQSGLPGSDIGGSATPSQFALAPSPGPAGATGPTPGAQVVRPGFYRSVPAVLHGGLGTSAQRTVALAVLLGIGVLLVAASSQNVRPPRSLLQVVRRPA